MHFARSLFFNSNKKMAFALLHLHLPGQVVKYNLTKGCGRNGLHCKRLRTTAEYALFLKHRYENEISWGSNRE